MYCLLFSEEKGDINQLFTRLHITKDNLLQSLMTVRGESKSDESKIQKQLMKR